MSTELSELPIGMGWQQGGAASMGPTLFSGLRPWTELERTLPGMQAKLPREPALDLLWASAGQERRASL